MIKHSINDVGRCYERGIVIFCSHNDTMRAVMTVHVCFNLKLMVRQHGMVTTVNHLNMA